MGTPWDASTYDRSSEPQQAWASEVLERLEGVAPDAAILLVPQGCVPAVDASAEMVELARRRLGERAEVGRQDVLERLNVSARRA